MTSTTKQKKKLENQTTKEVQITAKEARFCYKNVLHFPGYNCLDFLTQFLIP